MRHHTLKILAAALMVSTLVHADPKQPVDTMLAASAFDVRFPCPDFKKRYSLRAVTGKTTYVTPPYAVERVGADLCVARPALLATWRNELHRHLIEGDWEIGTPVYWSVQVEGSPEWEHIGVFNLRNVVAENFSSAPTSLLLVGPWQMEGGWLGASAARAKVSAITDFSPLLNDPKFWPKDRQAEGFLFEIKAEMFCPESSCAFSIFWDADRFSDTGNGSFQPSILRRIVLSNTSTSFFQWKGYGVKIDLPDLVVDLSYPKTIRLYVSKSETLVLEVVEDGKRYCLYRPAAWATGAAPNVGVSWESEEDDPNVSQFRIDSMTVKPLPYPRFGSLQNLCSHP